MGESSQSTLSRIPGGACSLAVALGAAAMLAVSAGTLSAQEGADRVTFARDVASILQENCQACHREGSIGPMSLISYDEVRPWAHLIKEKVASRAMPPWPYDRTIGIQELKHDPSLTDEEIATVVAWVDAGAPQGDPADLPPPIEWPQYSEYWQLEDEFGAPDIVVTTESYTVPAEGLDQWFDSEVPIPGIEGERWIRAVEIRPHTPESAYVFHHGNSSLRQRGADGNNEGTSLIAAAVGKMYDIMPSDSGLKLLPGATVTTGFHLFPSGEEIVASVDIAIYLYPEGEVPRYETEGSTTINADNTVTEDDGGWTKVSPVDAGGVRAVDIFIPPNSTQMLRGVWVVQRPTRIHSVRGHMHLRGKYQMVEAIYPDGRSEVLSKLNWEHRWHTDFLYEDHAMPLLPKGTMVVLTSFFDNPVNQPGNPDPNQLVVFGRRSVDEMSHIWIGRTFFEQDEFDRLVAEREQILREREQRAAVSQPAG
jgi:mono/diheme cytochrome c family protein